MITRHTSPNKEGLHLLSERGTRMRQSNRSELCDMIKEKTYADSEARKKPKTQKSSNTDNPNEKGRGVIKNPEDSDGSQVFELVPYLIEKMVST